ncbi:pentapeptide repeat-containing protein [bacterium]|jgi:uncharacterized protein YjbI with pentapeptide repeats|nr:pentapeptide repeat-containing protein [bacterium]
MKKHIILYIFFASFGLLNADVILMNNDPFKPISVWGINGQNPQTKLIIRSINCGGSMALIKSSSLNGIDHLWIIPNFGQGGGSIFPIKNNDCISVYPSQNCNEDNYFQSMVFGTLTKKTNQSWCTKNILPTSSKLEDVAYKVRDSYAIPEKTFEIEYSPISKITSRNSKYNEFTWPYIKLEHGNNLEKLAKNQSVAGLDFTNYNGKQKPSISKYIKDKVQKGTQPPVHLTGKLYSNCTFDGADLRGLNFDESWFSGCSFKKTNLNGVSMQNCTFEIGNKANVDFTKASLAGISLVGAAVKQANFDSSNLNNADLGYSTLKSPIFKACNLDSTIFQSTIFKKGSLSNNNLSKCVFNNAKLNGTKLNNTIFADIKNNPKATVQNDILTGMDLRGASLDGAIMVGMDFAGNNIKYDKTTTFRKTNLQKTKFCGSVTLKKEGK